MSATNTPGSGDQLTKAQLDQLADELITEKGSKVPGRIRAYLTNPDVRSALDKLVKAKIPLRDIQRGFVDKLGWKISPTVLRAFMKEEFGYPEPTATRVGAKKAAKTVKKAAKSRGKRNR